MSYSDFNLDRAQRALGLSLESREDMFRDVAEREPGPVLRATLEENVTLATAIHTEKARSELIVAPMLVEVRRQLDHRISLFSGVDFHVAPERGLSGTCDFLLARSPTQWVLAAPVMTIVEAKKDDIKAGLGQCAATMVAAQLYNEREGASIGAIYGAVTTGTLWQFLRLDGPVLALDEREHHIGRVAKILGILIGVMADGGGEGRLVA